MFGSRHDEGGQRDFRMNLNIRYWLRRGSGYKDVPIIVSVGVGLGFGRGYPVAALPAALVVVFWGVLGGRAAVFADRNLWRPDPPAWGPLSGVTSCSPPFATAAPTPIALARAPRPVRPVAALPAAPVVVLWGLRGGRTAVFADRNLWRPDPPRLGASLTGNRKLP